MKLLLFAIIISSSVFGQPKQVSATNKDSAAAHKPDSAQIKANQIAQTIYAINFTLADMKQSLYNKIDAPTYEVLLKLIDTYVDEKKKLFEVKKGK